MKQISKLSLLALLIFAGQSVFKIHCSGNGSRKRQYLESTDSEPLQRDVRQACVEENYCNPMESDHSNNLSEIPETAWVRFMNNMALANNLEHLNISNKGTTK